MTYSQTIEFLCSQLPQFQRIGAAAYKAGLDTTIALDNHFGNPHKSYKTVHVAGTNGKGSTSQMIYEALRAEGYSVGLYTSPHLVDFRERMVVDGAMIPKESVVRFVESIEGLVAELRPSFFELTVAMAFWWFRQMGVDYAVVEVGMGGRLDSTNIITPQVSVITNISFDHTQFLGDTLQKIAAEKAGIIKAGVPVVIGESLDEYNDVFRAKADEMGAEIFFADCEPRVPYTPVMKGLCQGMNAQTAYTALRVLGLSDEAIRTGIESAVVRGRWQTISEEPLVVCDTGHNEAGVRLVAQQLQELMMERNGRAKLYMVLGVVSDKDVQGMLALLPSDAHYIATRSSVERAMPAEVLYDHIKEFGYSVELSRNVELALKRAKELATIHDVIFVGGSTFTVADLLAL
ncbi:MAG: folylpolyglutamate synthase/dihydrofolate synthase family protein [Rikenellaceae bacterium]